MFSHIHLKIISVLYERICENISEILSRDCASAKLLATVTTVGFGIILQPHLSPLHWRDLVIQKSGNNNGILITVGII
jgi:hypothetical protein